MFAGVRRANESNCDPVALDLTRGLGDDARTIARIYLPRWVTVMADERSNAVPSVDVEELVELEELQEEGTDVTGEFTRPGTIASPERKSAPPGRVSVPPPVPKEAREARRSSLPPSASSSGLLSAPPAAGSITPSASGMFRIPAGPEPAAEPASPLMIELRELRASNDRLRLTVRLRDDRIQELERLLSEQRTRAAALQQELEGVRDRKGPDDLKRIRGIGAGFERALHALGITSFRQIAAWTPEESAQVARQIRALPGRIERERWIEHARELAAESTSGG